MFYFKKIISYFDYYEFGEKQKNCGHGKILVKDQKVTVEIHIKGLGSKESQMCDIYAKGREEKKLGRVVLNKGTGYYNACFQSDDMDGQGLCIFGVTGLRIAMDENRYCETTWKWGELPPEYAGMQNNGEEKVKQKEEEETRRKPKPEKREEWPGRKAEPEKREEWPEQKAIFGKSEEGTKLNAEPEGREEGTGPKAGPEKKIVQETVVSPGLNTESESDWPVWHLHVEPVREKEESKPQEEEKQRREKGEGIRKMESESEPEQEECKPTWRLSVEPARENTECEMNGKEAAFPKSMLPQNKHSDAVLHKTQMEEKVTGGRQSPEQEEMPLQKMLYDDKWKQLCCLYPVCHPFGADEEYISIAPKDFVILRKEYQNLVSNSFLLHSFYNYHHVILGKATDENEEMFYIGVPGAYLEREKKVAVMFGFEGFALSERGNSNRGRAVRGPGGIETGAFGYYMRKVEI